MTLQRYKRKPSSYAMDWSWFFEQIDMFEAAISEPDETSIDSVARTDFASGAFLRSSGVFKNAFAIKTNIHLRSRIDRAHIPSPVHARYTTIEIECDKYTIAKAAYRLRIHSNNDTDMAYCALAIGGRMVLEMSSLAHPKSKALLYGETQKHTYDFCNSGFVELLEGTNKAYLITFWKDTTLETFIEFHQELTLSEIR